MFESLTTTKLLGGTAIAGIFVAAWDKIKVYLFYFWGIFFVKVTVKNLELHTAFLSLLRGQLLQGLKPRSLSRDKPFDGFEKSNLSNGCDVTNSRKS